MFWIGKFFFNIGRLAFVLAFVSPFPMYFLLPESISKTLLMSDDFSEYNLRLLILAGINFAVAMLCQVLARKKPKRMFNGLSYALSDFWFFWLPPAFGLAVMAASIVLTLLVYGIYYVFFSWCESFFAGLVMFVIMVAVLGGAAIHIYELYFSKDKFYE